MVAGDVILVTEGRASSYGDGFLAYVAMGGADQLSPLHELYHGLVKPAYEHHSSQHSHDNVFFGVHAGLLAYQALPMKSLPNRGQL